MKSKISFIGIFLLCLFSCKTVSSELDYFDSRSFFSKDDIEENVVPYFYYHDKGMWKHLYKSSPPFLMPETKLESIIIPHHDITVAEQNSFYKGIAQRMSPTTIVVICPDHYEASKNFISVPDSIQFDSVDRKISLENNVIQKLLGSQIGEYMEVNNELWFKEHGVFVHTAFIGHYFPNAKIVPLALKPECRGDEFKIFRQLAEALLQTLDDNSLVIASVDLSHYQIPRMTNLHDIKTLNTIANMENPEHIEVDSPESLVCVMEYSKLKGCTIPVLFHQTSTFDYIPKEDVISTSHEYWGFYSAAQKTFIDEYKKNVADTWQRYSFIDYQNTLNQTIIIGGSGSPGFGIRTFVDWDRYESSKNAGDINTRKFAGEEARFLRGFDAYIFDCLSEEAQKANDIKILPRKHNTEYVKRILDENFHKTNLFVEECNLENLNEQSIKEILEEEKKYNSIGILVLSNNLKTKNAPAFNEAHLESLFTLYDVVVVRDNSGTKDTFAYIKEGHKKINLGIMHNSKKKAKGAFLVLAYKNGILSLEEFPFL